MFFATNVGFVHFDSTIQHGLLYFFHGHTNTAAELPCCFVGDGAAKIRMYVTPTVVYFASVLCLAALLTFPNQTRLTASLYTCLSRHSTGHESRSNVSV